MTYREVLQSIGYPETVLVIDFETYFTVDYSLTKLSCIEYIKHRMFEFTGVGTQLLNTSYGDLSPEFTEGPGVYDKISQMQGSLGINFDSVTTVAKNCKFDVTILKEKFGIVPEYTIDIDDLLRHYDSRMSHRMRDVAPMFSLQAKGDPSQFKGLRYAGMDKAQQNNLRDYTNGDVEIEASLFKILLPLLSNPICELQLARHTLDLYLFPKIKFNFQKAKELRQQMQEKINAVVAETGHTKKELSGNISFVKILQDALPDGEQVPMKQGKKKMIPAFAQEDDGMKALLIHKDDRVRQLARARQTIKSWPLHIKRIDSMISRAIVDDGFLRVPLNYYGGHTGRWSGGGD